MPTSFSSSALAVPLCFTPHLTNRIRHVPSADRHRATPCIVNLAIAQGPAAAAFDSGRALSHQPVAIRLLFCPLFLFFPLLLHPFFAFSFFARSLFPLPTPNHHLISVSPAASALHRFLQGSLDANLAGFPSCLRPALLDAALLCLLVCFCFLVSDWLCIFYFVFYFWMPSRLSGSPSSNDWLSTSLDHLNHQPIARSHRVQAPSTRPSTIMQSGSCLNLAAAT